jgi:hypothetical protein
MAAQLESAGCSGRTGGFHWLRETTQGQTHELFSLVDVEELLT